MIFTLGGGLMDTDSCRKQSAIADLNVSVLSSFTAMVQYQLHKAASRGKKNGRYFGNNQGTDRQ